MEAIFLRLTNQYHVRGSTARHVRNESFFVWQIPPGSCCCWPSPVSTTSHIDDSVTCTCSTTTTSVLRSASFRFSRCVQSSSLIGKPMTPHSLGSTATVDDSTPRTTVTTTTKKKKKNNQKTKNDEKGASSKRLASLQAPVSRDDPH